MKTLKTIALFAAATGLFSFTAIDSNTWKSDPSHASLNFTVLHFGISDIDGSFKKFDAKFTSAKEDFTDAVFEFTTDVNTISTNDEQRDTHLKSADFFDVAKFSTLTFKSKSITKLADKQYTINGDLTMHGVTKPIALNAFIAKGINLRSKKDFVVVKINGSLTRSAYGIGASVPSAMVSDEVTIKGSSEFGKE